MKKGTITCPECGHNQESEIPTNACMAFYKCDSCSKLIRPTEGDCCVFCSYGDQLCPVSNKAK